MSIDLESIAEGSKQKIFQVGDAVIPYFRRLLRFMALPYCYSQVNWSECSKSKTQVALDFLYIFFRLKYYPDNYSQCRLWEKNRSDWTYYYGSNYDPYQRRQLRKFVQPRIYEIVFQDKVISEMICKANKIPTPKVLTVLKKGESVEKVVKNIAERGICKLIFKPRFGKGGGGIICTEFEDGYVKTVKRGNDVSIAEMKADGELIVQEFINQHKDLRKVSTSTNTIRVVTIRKRNGEVLIVGTYARFGVGTSKVDNLSQGGISVAANIKTGELAQVGINRLSQIFYSHPTSGIAFEGFHIPLWAQVISLAKQVQSNFDFFPFLGMDIAVTPRGPILIEINSSYDNVALEQARGPVLDDPEVYRAFEEYDLFINNYQKNLKL
jgi:glutathione synthase/RimK-type ligase-like ATP-grasp enzyme